MPSVKVHVFGLFSRKVKYLYDVETGVVVQAHISSATTSFAAGPSATATGVASSAFGNYSSAALQGQLAVANGRFSFTGDAQGFLLTARAFMTIATATQTNLFLDGASAVIALPNHTTWGLDILVAARSTDKGTGAESNAVYRVVCAIKRDANAASTAIVGTPSYTVIAEDDAAWDIAVSADTTGGGLTITATGANSATINWVASVRGVQVGG